MRSCIAGCLSVLLFCSTTNAQAQLWSDTYGGPGLDESGAIAADSHGNIYVAGYTTSATSKEDYLLVKYDCVGQRQWVVTYDGPAHDSDKAQSVAVDADGSIIVTGRSTGIGAGEDYATIKYSPSGVQLWAAVNRVNGTGNGLDFAHQVVVDADRSIYVTGSSDRGGGVSEMLTVKYDTNGNQRWRAACPGLSGGSASAYALTVDQNGAVYVIGARDAGTGCKLTTVKYDSDGNQLWIQAYQGAGTESQGEGIGTDGSGNVYVGGFCGTPDNWDCITLSYAPDGTLRWERRYNGPANRSDAGYALAVDQSGNSYVTGYSEGAGSSCDIPVIKYDSKGNPAWERRLNANNGGGNSGHGIVIDGDGCCIVGYSDPDYVVARYTADGTRFGTTRIPDERGTAWHFPAVASMGSGMMAFAGTVTAHGGDICTVAIRGPAEFIVDPSGSGHYTDIQSAIDAVAEGDTVRVKPGEYLLADSLNYVGKGIAIRSEAGTEHTILRRNPASTVIGSVVSFMSGEDHGAILEGFTITGGTGTKCGDRIYELSGGGGIVCSAGASPIVKNCIIAENSAATGGGVLVMDGASPEFINCRILKNSATELGAGVAVFSGSVPVFRNCEICLNRNTESAGNFGYGGGLFSFQSAPELLNCQVVQNVSMSDYATGGGLFLQQSNGALRNSMIKENYCKGIYGNGGGICIEGVGRPEIDACDIVNNCGGIGGGMDVVNGATPVVRHCLLAGNTAYHDYGGGGIRCREAAPTIAYCRILSNSAKWGGGIKCHYASAEISHCLIAGNAAEFGGGGIACYGGPEALIRNCTIVQNVAMAPDVDQVGGVSCYQSIPVLLNSVLWENEPDLPICGFQQFCLLDQDPLFVQRGVYDFLQWQPIMAGETLFSVPSFVVVAGDYRLRAQSAAIDTADPVTPQEEDLDGNKVCEGPDIGAYEYLNEWCTMFRRGDVNEDGTRDIADPITILTYLFKKGPTPGCLDAADANNDGSVDIADAIGLLGYLFGGGNDLPFPFSECGRDGQKDALDCVTYPPCGR